jgi:uncharacterized membrane protein YccF (DUF307 family)
VRVANAARTRVAEHIHLLAILWFVAGALWLIPAVVMAGLAAVITVPLALHNAEKIAFVFVPGIFNDVCHVHFLACPCHLCRVRLRFGVLFPARTGAELGVE